MPEKTYKLIELVGVSDRGVDQAVKNAIARATKTVRNLDWFEVTEIRGVIESNKVTRFQVTLKVGFRILDDKELGKD
ncbi:MAG TPA: dodecin [Methylomirabilota bacterium]|jgi:hypothetical protein|nr:dodecin [Methylomirabilota bacterium]